MEGLIFGILWYEKGMPILLGFWEWRCQKREDAHITVTPDCYQRKESVT